MALASGFSRPPAWPPPFWLPQHAGRTPPGALRSRSSYCCSIVHYFRLVDTLTVRSTVFPAAEQQTSFIWAVDGSYPIQLNGTDSQPRGRRYEFRGLPLVGLECVCSQINRSFFIKRESSSPWARVWTYPSISQRFTRDANNEGATP